VTGVRLAHNVTLEDGSGVWLVEEPGLEVRDSGDDPGAVIVVGPPGASKSKLIRVRRKARQLARAGGPAAAAAGVDLGGGYRSARLEGPANGSRRNDVLAALTALGVSEVERLGDRRGVMVALFGLSATKRVGAAAWKAAAETRWSALRLAVAASDLLTPARLEDLLAMEAPPGAEVVPPCDIDDLARNMASVLDRYSEQRRLAILCSLWDDVANWNIATQRLRRGRSRRSRFSMATYNKWKTATGRAEDSYWSGKLGTGRRSAAEMLRWTPSNRDWSDSLRWVSSECMAATALMLTALDAEDKPIEAAITAHLQCFLYLHWAGFSQGPDSPCVRAHRIADATSKASDPWILGNRIYVDRQPVDRRELSAFFAPLFEDVSEMALATLRWAESLLAALRRARPPLGEPGSMVEWREAAGWIRAPDDWEISLFGNGPTLADRSAWEPGRSPSELEQPEDLLWLADLADVLAVCHGNSQARLGRLNAALPWFDCTTPTPPNLDPFAPRQESVPLALAGAAQVVSLGIFPPRRASSWRSIVDHLAARVRALNVSFELAEEIEALDGANLPGTDLRAEVARTPGQLVEWGNYMGNCIAGYSEEVNQSFALLALLGPSKTIQANVALRRTGGFWRVIEALARFNNPIPADLEAVLYRWAAGIGPAPDSSVPDVSTDVAPRPRRRRPDSSRARQLTATEVLSSHLGAPLEQPAVLWASEILGGIAQQLGWRGHGSSLGLYDALERAPRPQLAAAVGGWFGPTTFLSELWHATSIRPLEAALVSVAESTPTLGSYLSRLTGCPRTAPRVHDYAVSTM